MPLKGTQTLSHHIKHILIHGSACYLPHGATDIDLRIIVEDINLTDIKSIFHEIDSLNITDENYMEGNYFTFKIHLTGETSGTFDISFAFQYSCVNFHSNYDQFAEFFFQEKILIFQDL